MQAVRNLFDPFLPDMFIHQFAGLPLSLCRYPVSQAEIVEDPLGR